MMRRSHIPLALVFGLVAAFAARSSGSSVEFQRPGLITSVGQSSDIAVVKVLLNTKLKLGLGVNPQVEADQLKDLKTLVIVVGASTKGLGAAGIDFEKEAERAASLVKAARDRGIQVLAMHTGGESRRGKITDEMLSLVIPEAQCVVVVASGNQDGLLQRLAAPGGTEVIEVEGLVAAGDAVRTVFAD